MTQRSHPRPSTIVATMAAASLATIGVGIVTLVAPSVAAQTPPIVSATTARPSERAIAPENLDSLVERAHLRRLCRSASLSSSGSLLVRTSVGLYIVDVPSGAARAFVAAPEAEALLAPHGGTLAWFSPGASEVLVAAVGQTQQPRMLAVAGRTAAQVMAFSPDGQTLATVHSSDSGDVVALWRVADGTQIRLLPAGRAVVTALAFSPDGTQVAVGFDGTSARAFHVATGARGRTLTIRQSACGSLADYCADGGLPDSPVLALAVDDQGDIVAVRARHLPRTEAQRLEVSSTRRSRYPSTDTFAELLAAGLSPDGQSLLALQRSEGQIPRVLMRRLDGAAMRSVTDPAVDALAFRADGTQFLTVSRDRVVVHDTQSLAEVFAFDCSPGGQLAFGSTGTPLPDGWHRGSASMQWFAGLAGGRIAGGEARIATVGVERVHILRERDRSEVARVSVPRVSDWATPSLSPDRRYVAVATSDARVVLVDMLTAQVHRELAGADGAVTSHFAWTSASDVVVTIAQRGSLRAWRVSDGTLLQELPLPQGSELWQGVQASPVGAAFFFRVSPDSLGVWSVGDAPRILGRAAGPVHRHWFTTDGRTVLVWPGAEPLTAYRVRDGEVVASLPPRGSGAVQHVALAGSGNSVMVAWDDGVVMSANVTPGATWQPLRATGTAAPTTLGLSPAGTVGAVGVPGGLVELWDMATRQQVRSFWAGQWLVGVSFSPDGSLLAATLGDMTQWHARAWSTP